MQTKSAFFNLIFLYLPGGIVFGGRVGVGGLFSKESTK